jgi:hypothetical protein
MGLPYGWNKKMKCECGKEAKWIIFDQTPYERLFEPMCEACFQELIHMEGEMNVEFELIGNLTLEDVIGKANEKWKYINKKYENTLKEYSQLKKEKPQ